MATRQPSIGPRHTDFTYYTKGAPGTVAVPRENMGVISQRQCYLVSLEVQILSSAPLSPFLFVFDSNRKFTDPDAAPDIMSLRLPPFKLTPGSTFIFIPPVESIGISTPCAPSQLLAQPATGGPLIVAEQELLARPFDVGISYVLSPSDSVISVTEPLSGLAFTTARVRNVAF